ncbi:uncharacterized protein BJ171DRAFT_11958 [Polychytrium aggregatum]|uniref:uncharacterized protein n=1 Tax=Polychytrium aggregatum TaxID=110093 RepID=UPI0022FEFCC6|nr:uncharacterized protein BJ171DRAFT_11958 [Polychytrium aggregatum]KAI9206566.1 hypothetical protein BJ171DRAFT_11958 [Polychytrium aggregatum]
MYHELRILLKSIQTLRVDIEHDKTMLNNIESGDVEDLYGGTIQNLRGALDSYLEYLTREYSAMQDIVATTKKLIDKYDDQSYLGTLNALKIEVEVGIGLIYERTALKTTPLLSEAEAKSYAQARMNFFSFLERLKDDYRNDIRFINKYGRVRMEMVERHLGEMTLAIKRAWNQYTLHVTLIDAEHMEWKELRDTLKDTLAEKAHCEDKYEVLLVGRSQTERTCSQKEETCY